MTLVYFIPIILNYYLNFDIDWELYKVNDIKNTKTNIDEITIYYGNINIETMVSINCNELPAMYQSGNSFINRKKEIQNSDEIKTILDFLLNYKIEGDNYKIVDARVRIEFYKNEELKFVVCYGFNYMALNNHLIKYNYSLRKYIESLFEN